MNTMFSAEVKAVVEVSNALPLLDVRGVSIDYVTGKRVDRAVDRVSFSVQKGDRYTVMGHSGCGKSTLLKVIGGYHPVAEGAMLINDHPVGKPGLDRMVVWQDVENQLFPWFTIEENVEYPLIMKGMPKAEARDKALFWLETVGLTRVLGKYPKFLSGGQKQRVAIARGFAVEPEILLMDEPFSALDALTRHKLQDEVISLQERSHTTIFFVSHDIAEAVRISTKVLVLEPHPGRVKAELEGGKEGLDKELRDLIFDGHETEEGEE